ncbi:MAG: PTS sugar transporter subunit IIA [Candidatus Zixiibacteriota bacterium]|nr:MAG: PTS sugar transporter subunit IIA [candidate division Zixibacteria bacterium]
MKLSRYLKEELIKLEMETVIGPPPENGSLEKWRARNKELILEELVNLFDQGARIGNRCKLLVDFVNRERKATTAIGHGVAIPHIRSMQAKDFMLSFARSSQGYDFDAPDDEPVRLFFAMAAPPYDDSFYLKAFKALAELLHDEAVREELLAVTRPGEVIRILRANE